MDSARLGNFPHCGSSVGSAGREPSPPRWEFCRAVQVRRKRMGAASGALHLPGPCSRGWPCSTSLPGLQLWIIPSILGSSNLYFLSDDDWEGHLRLIYGSGLCGLFVGSPPCSTPSPGRRATSGACCPAHGWGVCGRGHSGLGPTAGRGEARCLGLSLAGQRGAQDGRPCATFASASGVEFPGNPFTLRSLVCSL